MSSMIKVNAHTKISSIIKSNSASIEAIASLSGVLEKLRNPLLRKVMAPRVNVAEAAKLGGCSVDDFRKALFPLGFIFEDLSDAVHIPEQADEVPVKLPEWLATSNRKDLVYLDVRGMISDGRDPLKQIIEAYNRMPSGQILCVINSFVPFPLIQMLRKKGATTFWEPITHNEFHTYFLKGSPAADSSNHTADIHVQKQSHANSNGADVSPGHIHHDNETVFNALAQIAFAGRVREIDVRHMSMPMPMQTILAALDQLPENHALHVFHKRIPVYLLEELADKKFQIHIFPESAETVRLLFHK